MGYDVIVFKVGYIVILLIKFQNREERLLWYLNIAYLLHALLAFLLFLEQFALTTHITTITLGCNVFTHALDGFASYNLSAYGSLNGYIKLLTRNELLQLGRQYRGGKR